MTQIDTKPWWASRTIIGAIVSVLALIAGNFGVSIAPEMQGEIVTLVLTLVGVAGSGLSIYGRLKAQKGIRRMSDTDASLARLLLLAILLGTTVISATACGSYTVWQAEEATPAQTVYAIQADYNSALASAAAYAESPAADPEVINVLRRLDAAAFDALMEAQSAVRSGRSAGVAAAVSAARSAVTAFGQYLMAQETDR